MLEEYIEKLRPEIEKIFKEDSSGHDIGHLERTMQNALFIQKYEGGDKLVIGIAAFLHDLHRTISPKLGKYCSPKESLPIIEKLLEKINFPKEKKEKVLKAIEFHEEYNWNDKNNKKREIEILILQDADNLDALGAIGIARTFYYGGAYKIPMYDKSIPINEEYDYSEDKENDPSSIHHFYHKLLKLSKYMNTKTAKKIAKGKTKIIKTFLKEFINECEGKYFI